MTSKHSPALKSIAILLVLSLAQVYVLANPSRALFGRLVTNSDSFVIVNGNNARTGETILSGASLQTPTGVAAIVQLDSLGRVDISPGTTLTLSFGEGNVAVEVSTGQAFLVTSEGINGSIKTPEGEVFRTDVGPEPAPDTAAVRACVRLAEVAYRKAVLEARQNLRNAASEAEAHYRVAMRAAKSEAERNAAKAAKREALRKAQLETRLAIRTAQLAKQEATRACRSQAQAPSETANSPRPSFGNIFIPGLGIIGGSILGAIYVPCRRGRNPSPGDPRGRNDECRRGF